MSWSNRNGRTARRVGEADKPAGRGAVGRIEIIALEVLEANGWNRNATADALGVNRTTLYKKMKRLGLEDAAYAEQ